MNIIFPMVATVVVPPSTRKRGVPQPTLLLWLAFLAALFCAQPPTVSAQSNLCTRCSGDSCRCDRFLVNGACKCRSTISETCFCEQCGECIGQQCRIACVLNILGSAGPTDSQVAGSTWLNGHAETELISQVKPVSGIFALFVQLYSEANSKDPWCFTCPSKPGLVSGKFSFGGEPREVFDWKLTLGGAGPACTTWTYEILNPRIVAEDSSLASKLELELRDTVMIWTLYRDTQRLATGAISLNQASSRRDPATPPGNDVKH